jgi:hypothetical protein
MAPLPEFPEFQTSKPHRLRLRLPRSPFVDNFRSPQDLEFRFEAFNSFGKRILRRTLRTAGNRKSRGRLRRMNLNGLPDSAMDAMTMCAE